MRPATTLPHQKSMLPDRSAQPSPQPIADLQIAVAAFVAGAGWLFSIHALAELPPLLFLGSRFIIAGLLIGLLAKFPSVADIGRAVRLLFPGAFAFAVAMMAWIFGLKHTTNPGVAAFISSTGNLLVPVFGLLFFGWPVGKRLWISITIALAGMALLFLGPDARVEAAHVYFVVSALLWAASIALVKRNSAKVGAVAAAAVQLVVSGVVILAVSSLAERMPTAIPSGNLGLVSREHPDLDLPALRSSVSRAADDLGGAGVGHHVLRTGLGAAFLAGISRGAARPVPDARLRGHFVRHGQPGCVAVKIARLKLLLHYRAKRLRCHGRPDHCGSPWRPVAFRAGDREQLLNRMRKSTIF